MRKIVCICAAAGMLAAAASAEFRVNAWTTGDQGDSYNCTNQAGHAVIVWRSWGQDGSAYGDYGRVIDAYGNFLSDEFRVHTYTQASQLYPCVSLDAVGNFLCTWDSYNQDGTSWSVFGQWYTPDAVKDGPERCQHTTTEGSQIHSNTTMWPDGSYVIVWQSYGQDGDGWGVYGQRYDADRNKVGPEFRLSAATWGHQQLPTVWRTGDGGFVTSWETLDGDFNPIGIYARKFDPNGNPLTGDLPCSTGTSGPIGARCAASDSGRFVVTWEAADSSGLGVWARLFDENANPVKGPWRVNTYTNDHQENVNISMTSDGRFIIVWESKGQDGDGYGVYGQAFRPDGSQLGREFRGSTTTASGQHNPCISLADDGRFVLSWSYLSPSTGWDVCGDVLRLSLSDEWDAGWHLVSIPVELPDFSMAAVFDDVTAAGNTLYNNLYRYRAGYGYQVYPGDFAAPSRTDAYWLYLSHPAQEVACGRTYGRTEQIPLLQGWNMVGFPHEAPVPWAECTINRYGSRKNIDEAAAAGWIEKTAYYYDGTYRILCTCQPADDTMLRPWRGYWLLANTTGLTLEVPPPAG